MALLGRLLLVAALAGGCFEPDERDGTLRCGPAGECPHGFECTDGLCWRGEPLVSVPECQNGLDDDCDGKTDHEDPGCENDADESELGSKKCDDGIDNDADGLIDFHPAACGLTPDPGCERPDDDSEG